MTAPNTAAEQNAVEKHAAQSQADKEINFRNLQAKYQKELDKANAERAELENQLKALKNAQHSTDDDDDDGESYVDKRKLEKKLNSFERKLEDKIDKRAEEKARIMMYEDKRQTWLKTNPDFYDVLKDAEKFANDHPELAETILNMPEGFERQKLVYKNIKALYTAQEKAKTSGIQEKIDANRRSPFYQPSGIGNAPYSGGGDFSTTGQKNAYEKMQELKKKMRI